MTVVSDMLNQESSILFKEKAVFSSFLKEKEKYFTTFVKRNACRFEQKAEQLLLYGITGILYVPDDAHVLDFKCCAIKQGNSLSLFHDMVNPYIIVKSYRR